MKTYMLCVCALMYISPMIMASRNVTQKEPHAVTDHDFEKERKMSAMIDSARYYQAIKEPIPQEVMNWLNPKNRVRATTYNRNLKSNRK